MLDIIKDYEMLQKNFGVLLEKSGYRLDHLATSIGIHRNNFYQKKSRGTFSHTEMKKLLKIVWTPEMEDIIEGKILKKSDKGNFASKEEIKEAFK